MDKPNVSVPKFWDRLYDSEKAGWDMGTPTPVFTEMIKDNELNPCRICILGSGSGHDAIFFAQHGFDVVSVEFSSSAAKMQKHKMMESKIEYELLNTDLFDLPKRYKENFDLVIEYVTMCALDRNRYVEYAQVVYDILKTGGQYVSLLFPIEVRKGGPPFAMDASEVVKIFSKSFKVITNKVHNATIKPRKGRERLLVFEKNS